MYCSHGGLQFCPGTRVWQLMATILLTPGTWPLCSPWPRTPTYTYPHTYTQFEINLFKAISASLYILHFMYKPPLRLSFLFIVPCAPHLHLLVNYCIRSRCVGRPVAGPALSLWHTSPHTLLMWTLLKRIPFPRIRFKKCPWDWNSRT